MRFVADVDPGRVWVDYFQTDIIGQDLPNQLSALLAIALLLLSSNCSLPLVSPFHDVYPFWGVNGLGPVGEY